MRHANYRFSLGRKKEHREATMAALATALFTHGRIQTTLAKAKALRPFAERIITHAKKGHLANDRVKWLHHFRIVLSRVRDEYASKLLMEERVTEFLQRNGGYTRIYKLMPRRGDAAPMAIIELIAADDEGYPKRKLRPQKSKDASAEPGFIEDASPDVVTDADGEETLDPVASADVAEDADSDVSANLATEAADQPESEEDPKA